MKYGSIARIHPPIQGIALSILLTRIPGLILGALDSWPALCAMTFFVGFGLGGNIPIDATIVLEFLPNVGTSHLRWRFPRVLSPPAGPPLPRSSTLDIPANW